MTVARATGGAIHRWWKTAPGGTAVCMVGRNFRFTLVADWSTPSHGRRIEGDILLTMP